MTPDQARRASRIGLGLLAITAVALGAWAVLAPRSFYDDFPGFGRQWISPDGPFNEHFVRDFGALNLALGVFTLGAAVSVLRPMVIAAALAWIVWPLPHLAYHLSNLGPYDTTDQIGIVASLAVSPVVAVGVLLVARRLPARA